MYGVILRSSSARLIASSTIGSPSFATTISTDSPGWRMPIPLPCSPDWLRTSVRAAGTRSSADFGGLKYDGQRGSEYFSFGCAPARELALAPALDSDPEVSVRWHAPARTAALSRSTQESSFI